MNNYGYYKHIPSGSVTKALSLLGIKPYPDSSQYELLSRKEGIRLYSKQMADSLKVTLDAAYAQVKGKKIKPTVYCQLKHVSASGMRREIALYVIVDNELTCLTYYASIATNRRIGKKDGIVIDGCGMDMGFALVDDMMNAVYGHGYNWQSEWRQTWI